MAVPVTREAEARVWDQHRERAIWKQNQIKQNNNKVSKCIGFLEGSKLRLASFLRIFLILYI